MLLLVDAHTGRSFPANEFDSNDDQYFGKIQYHTTEAISNSGFPTPVLSTSWSELYASSTLVYETIQENPNDPYSKFALERLDGLQALVDEWPAFSRYLGGRIVVRQLTRGQLVATANDFAHWLRRHALYSTKYTEFFQWFHAVGEQSTLTPSESDCFGTPSEIWNSRDTQTFQANTFAHERGIVTSRVWTQEQIKNGDRDPYLNAGRDPRHDWGIMEIRASDVINRDTGNLLLLTHKWVCCGQDVNHPGCWIGPPRTTLEPRPYDFKPQLQMSVIWRRILGLEGEYLDEQTFLQTYWEPTVRGDAWLNQAYYDRLHTEIQRIKTAAGPMLYNVAQSIYERQLEDVDAPLVIDSNLIPSNLGILLERLYELQQKYNAPHCLEDGDDRAATPKRSSTFYSIFDWAEAQALFVPENLNVITLADGTRVQLYGPQDGGARQMQIQLGLLVQNLRNQGQNNVADTLEDAIPVFTEAYRNITQTQTIFEAGIKPNVEFIVNTIPALRSSIVGPEAAALENRSAQYVELLNAGNALPTAISNFRRGANVWIRTTTRGDFPPETAQNVARLTTDAKELYDASFERISKELNLDLTMIQILLDYERQGYEGNVLEDDSFKLQPLKDLQQKLLKVNASASNVEKALQTADDLRELMRDPNVNLTEDLEQNIRNLLNEEAVLRTQLNGFKSEINEAIQRLEVAALLEPEDLQNQRLLVARQTRMEQIDKELEQVDFDDRVEQFQQQLGPALRKVAIDRNLRQLEGALQSIRYAQNVLEPTEQNLRIWYNQIAMPVQKFWNTDADVLSIRDDLKIRNLKEDAQAIRLLNSKEELYTGWTFGTAKDSSLTNLWFRDANGNFKDWPEFWSLWENFIQILAHAPILVLNEDELEPEENDEIDNLPNLPEMAELLNFPEQPLRIRGQWKSFNLPQDFVPPQPVTLNQYVNAQHLVTASDFKWKGNSCWADTALRSLFKLPTTQLQQQIWEAKQLRLYVHQAEYTNGEALSLSPECNSQKAGEFHEAIIMDIQRIQDPGGLLMDRCSPPYLWNACLQEKINLGNPNPNSVFITMFQEMYNLGTQIQYIPLSLGPFEVDPEARVIEVSTLGLKPEEIRNLLTWMKDDEFTSNGVEFKLQAVVADTSPISATERHFVSYVYDPSNRTWYYFNNYPRPDYHKVTRAQVAQAKYPVAYYYFRKEEQDQIAQSFIELLPEEQPPIPPKEEPPKPLVGKFVPPDMNAEEQRIYQNVKTGQIDTQVIVMLQRIDLNSKISLPPKDDNFRRSALAYAFIMENRGDLDEMQVGLFAAQVFVPDIKKEDDKTDEETDEETEELTRSITKLNLTQQEQKLLNTPYDALTLDQQGGIDEKVWTDDTFRAAAYVKSLTEKIPYAFMAQLFDPFGEMKFEDENKTEEEEIEETETVEEKEEEKKEEKGWKFIEKNASRLTSTKIGDPTQYVKESLFTPDAEESDYKSVLQHIGNAILKLKVVAGNPVNEKGPISETQWKIIAPAAQTLGIYSPQKGEIQIANKVEFVSADKYRSDLSLLNRYIEDQRRKNPDTFYWPRNVDTKSKYAKTFRKNFINFLKALRILLDPKFPTKKEERTNENRTKLATELVNQIFNDQRKIQNLQFSIEHYAKEMIQNPNEIDK